MPKPGLKKRSMTAGLLAMTVFCCVSGGPFGLEGLITETGSGFALLLILAIPVLWAIPDSLITAELAPAIPAEGGYIVWVQRAMGPFAGFLNAWWTWMYSLLDATIYPVLFAKYMWILLSQINPNLEKLSTNDWVLWATALPVIVIFSLLNIRGTRLVGRASTLFTFLIVAPFVVMVAVGFWRMGGEPRPIIHEFLLPGKTPMQALSTGLAIALWNYLGWDALSTIAEEVDDPAKAYPRALMIGVILVTAVYALPTIVGLAFFPDGTKWEDAGWPLIAKAVGGPWLMNLMQVSALVSPIALFTAALLASSRVPFVLAEEGYLPRKLAEIHPRFGTPWVAILVCSTVYTIFAFQKFEDLVELNVIMYCSALALESASLVVLRFKEPNLPRPFKIPGGLPVLLMVFILPIALAGLMVFAMADEAIHNPDTALVRQQLAIVSALIVSGPVIYLFVRKRKQPL